MVWVNTVYNRGFQDIASDAGGEDAEQETACMYDGNNLFQNGNKKHQQTTKQATREANDSKADFSGLHVR